MPIITRKIEITSPDSAFWNDVYFLHRHTFRWANQALSQLRISTDLEEAFSDPGTGEADQVLEAEFAKPKKERDPALIKVTKADKNDRLKEAKRKARKLLFGNEGVYPFSQQNIPYETFKLLSETSDTGLGPSSYVRSALAAKVYKDYTSDRLGVLKGLRAERSYRSGLPTPFMKGAIGQLTLTGCRLLGHPVSFVLRKDRSRNGQIIQGILADSYQLCDSSLRYDPERNKAYLLLAEKVPPKLPTLQPQITAIVDISFMCPVLVWNAEDAEVFSVGDIEHLLKLRMQLNRRRESLQARLVTSRGGHGRKRKLKGLDQFTQIEKNIARTETHKIAKRVIDLVLRMRAGQVVIMRQALSEADERNFQLRFWGYFDLIEKIKYTAALQGVVVRIEVPAGGA